LVPPTEKAAKVQGIRELSNRQAGSVSSKGS
jgi:hypothetical protein